MTVAAVASIAEPPAMRPLAAQAAAARVAELCQLIARAESAPPPSNGGASFPTALASAAASPALAATQPLASASGPQASPYDGLIVAAAQRHGIDPALLHGLVRAESSFDPTVTSPAGAQGLCQLMPGTAAALGVTDPFDPAQSLDGGARYLRQQLDAFGGDPALALAAYNAGPGAVRRYGGVPPYAETQAYVRKVLDYAAAYRAAAPATAVGAFAGGFAPPTVTPTAPLPPMAAAAPPTSLPYKIT